ALLRGRDAAGRRVRLGRNTRTFRLCAFRLRYFMAASCIGLAGWGTVELVESDSELAVGLREGLAFKRRPDALDIRPRRANYLAQRAILGRKRVKLLLPNAALDHPFVPFRLKL